MPKSCLDEYLTEGCATCPDWKDGSNPKEGIGCATHMPILWCPYFEKMLAEEASKEKREES